MSNLLLDIKYSDLSKDLQIQSSRAGYNYIKIFLKDATNVDIKHTNKLFDILYLSKHDKHVVHIKNCHLALIDYAENMYSFRYLISSRDSMDFNKRSYLRLKLISYLKCY